jgi:hypothetical protein
MDGALVKVCNRGWSDGQLRLDVTNIRNQLEMLYHNTRDTGTDPKNDTDDTEADTKKEAEKTPDTSDTGTDTSGSDDTRTDTGNSDTGDTVDTKGVSGISPDTNDTMSAGIDSKSDTGGDTADTADTTSVSGDDPDTSDAEDDTADTEGDTAAIAHRLAEAQLVSLIKSMAAGGMNQTQIICSLWGVEKNKTGWKAAYTRFKELMGE